MRVQTNLETSHRRRYNNETRCMNGSKRTWWWLLDLYRLHLGCSQRDQVLISRYIQRAIIRFPRYRRCLDMNLSNEIHLRPEDLCLPPKRMFSTYYQTSTYPRRSSEPSIHETGDALAAKPNGEVQAYTFYLQTTSDYSIYSNSHLTPSGKSVYH